MSRPAHSLTHAFRCAAAGIARTAHERNFKIECGVGVLAVVLAATLKCSATEWLVIVAFIAAVLSAECANSALEALVDLAQPDNHPLAAAAKDTAAGAVLILSMGALIAAAIIFLPKLIALVG